MVHSIGLAVVDGILEGSVYGLMAAGLTLIFGVMEIVNIAQGALVVLGAYLSYALSTRLGIDPLVGLLITGPAMFILGVALYVFLIRRLKGRDRVIASIMITFAVALLIQGVLTAAYGANFVQLSPWYVTRSLHVFGLFLPYIYLFGFLLAVLLLGILFAVLYKTRFGYAVRAATQNRTAAQLVGINVERVSAISFGIGVAVTAAGGMVFGAINTFSPNSGNDLISRLLTIIILGGMGSVGGAFAAGIAMLVTEDIVAVLWSPTWSVAVFFVVLVVVLTARPEGLFGRSVARI